MGDVRSRECIFNDERNDCLLHVVGNYSIEKKKINESAERTDNCRNRVPCVSKGAAI